MPTPAQTPEELAAKKCTPCEGGVDAYSRAQSEAQLTKLNGWTLSPDAKRIRKEIQVVDFLTGLALFQKVGQLAESQGHHPDLHLESYRHVTIELWTHGIGGLSENDFILAAQINQITTD